SPSRSVQTLAYEEIRTSDKPFDSTALVIHGVLGSSQYLKPFSGELLSELQKSSRSNVWRMVLVDLRNHGRSADLKGFDPPHDMFNAANDLSNLVKCHGWAWPDVVIGHSMGGKVGLEFISSCARGDYGESALSRLWVLDTFLGKINSSDGITEVEKILHAMQSLPSSLPSQKWVVNQMIEHGFSKPVSEWIGSNLKESGEHLTWAFNLQAVIDMFNSYRKFLLVFVGAPTKGLKIDIVRAENSERWNESVLQKLADLASKEERSDEGKVLVHVLPNSGHWVQADNPKGLLEIMSSNFISKD
ncbi:Quorum-quenching N-acyl-homoserine lactonase protein, partial [Dioscorea alata]